MTVIADDLERIYRTAELVPEHVLRRAVAELRLLRAERDAARATASAASTDRSFVPTASVARAALARARPFVADRDPYGSAPAVLNEIDTASELLRTAIAGSVRPTLGHAVMHFPPPARFEVTDELVREVSRSFVEHRVILKLSDHLIWRVLAAAAHAKDPG